jgi:oxygen-independent coproporphyrinogen-3 oxidase
MRGVSAYIHVPFCSRRCPYCTFYHVPYHESLESGFAAAAAAEIESAVDCLRKGGPSRNSSPGGEDFIFRTIYFGGGTPSTLHPESVEKILGALLRGIPGLPDETTFEMNPEDVAPEYLRFLFESGVDRLSLGIQSMSARAQETLGRSSIEVNRFALEETLKVFDNVNVDVLLGIPGGDEAELQSTLEKLVEYEPKHFSVYCLEAEKGSPERVLQFVSRADENELAVQYLAACGFLERHGYVHYEVSNFALPGWESKHNRVYWRMGDYVGIGPAAHSCIRGERMSNPESLDAYLAGAGRGFMDAKLRENPSPEARFLESLMLGLRTREGIPLAMLSGSREVLEALVAQDLGKIEGDSLVLTDLGFLLLDEIVVTLSRSTSLE